MVAVPADVLRRIWPLRRCRSNKCPNGAVGAARWAPDQTCKEENLDLAVVHCVRSKHDTMPKSYTKLLQVAIVVAIASAASKLQAQNGQECEDDWSRSTLLIAECDVGLFGMASPRDTLSRSRATVPIPAYR